MLFSTPFSLTRFIFINTFLRVIGNLYKSPEFVNYILISNSDLLILINHLKIYHLKLKRMANF